MRMYYYYYYYYCYYYYSYCFWLLLVLLSSRFRLEVVLYCCITGADVLSCLHGFIRICDYYQLASLGLA